MHRLPVKKRQGPTIQKILQLFRLFLPKNTKTLLRLKKFTDLDPQKIEKKKGSPLKAFIIDADDTIAPNHQDFLPENLDHLHSLHKQGYKIIIYSNYKVTERYRMLDKEIKILVNVPAKPDKRGFQEALHKLGEPADSVVMVGDSYITDAGCLRCDIPYIWVKPIKTRNKNLFVKVEMFIYGLIRSFYYYVSLLHEKGRDLQ